MTDYKTQEKVDSLKKDEELIVSYQKKKKTKTPPYIALGNGLLSKNFDNSDVVDALRVFGSLTPAQQQIVHYFKDKMLRNQMQAHYANQKLANPNLVELSKSKEDDEAQAIRKLLRANGNGKVLSDQVLRKISSTEYMLNPFMFIPHDDFDKVAEKWKALESNPEKKTDQESE